jgi:predicted nucleic acid-binding protein
MLLNLHEIGCMNAVDTNILIYVNDSRDPSKREIASSLVASLTDGVLIWQVACEYLAASRKLEPLGYDRVLWWITLR